MKKTNSKMLFFAAIAFLSAGFASCGDDDEGNKRTEGRNGSFFISAQNEDGSAEYLLQVGNLDGGEIDISANFSGDLEMNGYTWVFGSDPSVAVGLIYNQGDPGIGLLYGMDANGLMEEIGNGFQISTRFTSYGFFDKYAVTSVGGVTSTEYPSYEDGSPRSDAVTFNRITLDSPGLVPHTIQTLDVFREGEQATFSGVVDLGNGTFMTGAVVSLARDEETATGGSSSGTVMNPDECWVAIIDSDFKIAGKYSTDKISYSSGRYRSQYYSQIGKTNDGTIYVFSGSYDASTTKKAGAVKFKNTLDGFDDSYYFDIQSKSDNYIFRKVWYITDHYFMIELYDSPGPINSTLAPASNYGIVDMKSKTFTRVTGIPGQSQTNGTDESGNTIYTGGIVASGLPMAHNGKMYFPLKGYGENAAVYIVDPATGIAAKGLVVTGASSIRALGRLNN